MCHGKIDHASRKATGDNIYYDELIQCIHQLRRMTTTNKIQSIGVRIEEYLMVQSYH